MSFKLASIVALGCVYSQHLRGSAPASDSLWGVTAAAADDGLWQLIPADLWADVNVQSATPRPRESIWDDAGTTAAALPPAPAPDSTSTVGFTLQDDAGNDALASSGCLTGAALASPRLHLRLRISSDVRVVLTPTPNVFAPGVVGGSVAAPVAYSSNDHDDGNGDGNDGDGVQAAVTFNCDAARASGDVRGLVVAAAAGAAAAAATASSAGATTATANTTTSADG